MATIGCWVLGEPPVAAEVHRVRSVGKTLIEAEGVSATTGEFPFAEPCKRCSNGRNLGYFWKDSWFEIEIQVPQQCNYRLSLRTSSIEGTRVQLFVTGADGVRSSEVAEIKVPQTRIWSHYTTTESIMIALSAGRNTLRFKNLGEGANIDYLTFVAETKLTSKVSYRLPRSLGPDRNPLKGFGSAWWREDEYASVGFQYIEWGDFEPRDDEFDWDYVESVIARKGTLGRHVILQFVVDWDTREPVEDNYLGPDWLLKRVGEHRGHADPDDPVSREMRATKYNEPAYIEEATEAIEALAAYFHDDPRVFVLQAGLLGFWSEWHTFPREDWSPSDETKTTILKTYLTNLPEDRFTQIRYPNEAAVRPQSRVGYTNGSATLTEHGYEFGRMVEQNKLWKNGPITGEWPPNVDRQHWINFFQTDEGTRFIEQARYSMLLVPEHKHIREQIPDWTPKDQFLSMHRQLGYNFQVDRVKREMGKAGLSCELSLANVGIAPFYLRWETQLALLDGTASEVRELKTIETDLRSLQPGESTALKAVFEEPLDGNRNYRIGLRILQPGADKPKSGPWKLDARNVFVVLANDVETTRGHWNEDEGHSLQGGWNLIGEVVSEAESFPFKGSIRPLQRSVESSAESK
ncbi:MAG: DUF4832 domain-containing protein [Planctomycetota bacterium]